MDHQTLKATIAQLALNPWHAHVLSVLQQIHGVPLPELVERAFVEIATHDGLPQKQITAWVGNYSFVGEAISSGKGNGSDFSIFWIRLQEILNFLPEYFGAFESSRTHLEILGLVRGIAAAYSAEEKLMIEYQRNCHAHIHQNGYRFRATYTKSGILKEDGLYRNGMHKDTLSRVLDDELKKYSWDERAMANAYFHKTDKLIDKLWTDLKNLLRQRGRSSIEPAVSRLSSRVNLLLFK